MIHKRYKTLNLSYSLREKNGKEPPAGNACYAGWLCTLLSVCPFVFCSGTEMGSIIAQLLWDCPVNQEVSENCEWSISPSKKKQCPATLDDDDGQSRTFWRKIRSRKWRSAVAERRWSGTDDRKDNSFKPTTMLFRLNHWHQSCETSDCLGSRRRESQQRII